MGKLDITAPRAAEEIHGDRVHQALDAIQHVRSERCNDEADESGDLSPYSGFKRYNGMQLWIRSPHFENMTPETHTKARQLEHKGPAVHHMDAKVIHAETQTRAMFLSAGEEYPAETTTWLSLSFGGKDDHDDESKGEDCGPKPKKRHYSATVGVQFNVPIDDNRDPSHETIIKVAPGEFLMGEVRVLSYGTTRIYIGAEHTLCGLSNHAMQMNCEKRVADRKACLRDCQYAAAGTACDCKPLCSEDNPKQGMGYGGYSFKHNPHECDGERRLKSDDFMAAIDPEGEARRLATESQWPCPSSEDRGQNNFSDLADPFDMRTSGPWNPDFSYGWKLHPINWKKFWFWFRYDHSSCWRRWQHLSCGRYHRRLYRWK
jgi:hypothetical protein